MGVTRRGKELAYLNGTYPMNRGTTGLPALRRNLPGAGQESMMCAPQGFCGEVTQPHAARSGLLAWLLHLPFYLKFGSSRLHVAGTW